MKEININFKEIIDYIREKDLEIENLKYKNLKMYNEKEKYKSRNEKTIEYIRENCIDNEFYINLTNKEKNIIKAFNILQGEDDSDD